MQGAANWITQKLGLAAAMGKMDAGDYLDLNKDRTDLLTRRLDMLPSLNAPAEREKDAHKPPVHNTTIHRVEIKVQGDPDPSRVAKMTLAAILDLQRHPLVSRGGPQQFSRT